MKEVSEWCWVRYIDRQTTQNTTPDDSPGVATDAAGVARSLLLLVVKAGVGQTDAEEEEEGVARQVCVCVCVQECGPRLSGLAGWLQLRPAPSLSVPCFSSLSLLTASFLLRSLLLLWFPSSLSSCLLIPFPGLSYITIILLFLSITTITDLKVMLIFTTII